MVQYSVNLIRVTDQIKKLQLTKKIEKNSFDRKILK